MKVGAVLSRLEKVRSGDRSPRRTRPTAETADILSRHFPATRYYEQTTQHLCIQGWSGVAKWGGVSMSTSRGSLVRAPSLLYLASAVVQHLQNEWPDD